MCTAETERAIAKRANGIGYGQRTKWAAERSDGAGAIDNWEEGMYERKDAF